MREAPSPRQQRCDSCGTHLPQGAVRRFYPDPANRRLGQSLDVLCALRALNSGRIADRGANLERIAALLARVLTRRHLASSEAPIAVRLRPAILEASAALVALDLLGGRHE